jgi:hypothetical protein
MDWQQTTVICIVVITTLAFASAWLRRRKNRIKNPCEAASGNERPPVMVLHCKKGQRPTLTIKSQ